MYTAYGIIDKLLWLAIFVVSATALWHSLGPGEGLRRLVGMTEQPSPEPVVRPDDVALGETQEGPTWSELAAPAYAASPLLVRHLTDAATLLVRYRARKSAWTAHLIVWSGAKRKGISDSYYDLGLIEAVEQSGELVEQFLPLARAKLDELAEAGKRKRKRAPAKEAEVVSPADPQPVEIASVPAQDEVPSEASSPVVEEMGPPEQVKLKRFPNVYCGIIKHVGMMTQKKGDDHFETFGVRMENQEGVVEEVFGSHLRTALREAGAGVGDNVEILKIGRKTVDSGKAPMNLFQVAKLPAAQVAT